MNNKASPAIEDVKSNQLAGGGFRNLNLGFPANGAAAWAALFKTPFHAFWKILLAAFLKSIRVHTLFIFIVVFYAGAFFATASLLEVNDDISLLTWPKASIITLAVFLFAFFAVYSTCVMIFIRPDKLIKYIRRELWSNYITKERILNALPVIVFMPLFMSTFSSFKSLIPLINPFSWDPVFAKIDGIIHGGVHVWEIYHPLLGTPIITSALNFLYNIWFLIFFGVLYWQVFSLRDPRLRMQYLLSCILSWVLIGTVAASIFSSAGPCYYGRIIDGDNIYQPLMEYLSVAKESYPVWALNTQENLWESYKQSKTSLGSGISAMPSMHVSMAVLFALVGWRSNRITGIILSFYAVIIMIGSVHLGWHYAVDGYVSIIGTLFIWYFMGCYTRHIEKAAPTKDTLSKNNQCRRNQKETSIAQAQSALSLPRGGEQGR